MFRLNNFPYNIIKHFDPTNQREYANLSSKLDTSTHITMWLTAQLGDGDGVVLQIFKVARIFFSCEKTDLGKMDSITAVTSRPFTSTETENGYRHKMFRLPTDAFSRMEGEQKFSFGAVTNFKLHTVTYNRKGISGAWALCNCYVFV